MNCDAIIQVRFNRPDENGRQTEVCGEYYGCPMIIDDKAFDCRILMEGKCLELGETYEVPVKFLNKVLVNPYLKDGVSFTLWEGKDVAKGVVLRVLA